MGTPISLRVIEMADTSYGVNHPLAVKVWTRKMIHEPYRSGWFSKFVGDDSNSLIHLHPDLQKGPGDTVYPMLRAQLTGDGVQGEGTLEGSEEELQTSRDSVVLDQLRHAVRSKGRVSEQRVPFSVREEAYIGLTDWFTVRKDVGLMNQLGGNTNITNTRYTLNNATRAPSTNNHLFVGGTAEASLSASASSAFSLTVIDRMVTRAKTKANQPVRPLMIDGEEKYVVFIHPFQKHQLRVTAAASGNWLDIQKAVLQGGKINSNPIYTGAVGEWNQCVIHESNYVPGGSGSSGIFANTNIGVASVYRAVLAGADALQLCVGNGYGTDPAWFEELFDYGAKLGVACGWIYGGVKAQFTVNAATEDFATVVASTFSPDPS